jgi:hypothetical protein
MEADRSRWSGSDLAKRANQGDVTAGRHRLGALSETERQRERLAWALRNLYDILESHAPMWYTQEHHEKAESALRQGGKVSVDVFIELCDLLEEYAPSWYRKEDYDRVRFIRLELLEQ